MPEQHHMSKWDDEFILESYKMARAGMSDQQIAKSLGVRPMTFAEWRKKKRLLRKALKDGREDAGRGDVKGLVKYVYGMLPDHLQKLWDDIKRAEEMKSPIAKIERMLEDGGIRARQHLFLYALYDANFNASEACRKVNICKTTLDRWIATDPNFGDLISEMEWHKSNFFEGALFALVKAGHPGAVLFANRTKNKDRGYSEKTVIEHTGQIEHVHAAVPMDQLKSLSIEDRKKILHALRDHREEVKMLKAAEGDVIDAEVVEE